MPNQFLNAFSSIAVVLNRGLAYLDRAVHYASGYILYYLFNGLKPQTHTRPCKTRHGRYYSPAVVVTGASEGENCSSSLLFSSLLSFLSLSLFFLYILL